MRSLFLRHGAAHQRMARRSSPRHVQTLRLLAFSFYDSPGSSIGATKRSWRLARHSSSQVTSTVVVVPDDSDGGIVPTTRSSSSSGSSSSVDFYASAKIEGEESQIVIITLKPGQTLRAESGSMIYMTEGVQMETALSDVSSAMKRFMTGQNLFVTDFTYQHGTKKEGTVALGTDFHSKILRLHLPDYPDQTLVCQKGAYLASNPDVNIEMAFTKNFASGFFGGQGFVLQKLEGDGDVLIKAGGTLVTKELKEGETLRVTSGSLVAFTATVDYDVQMIKGAKNVIFGGEGLFITTLKGPGTVWLQGMPPDRMISEIARRMPPGGLGFGIPIGMGGGGGGGEGGGGGVAGEDVSGTEGVGGEAGEGVAATDAAVEADRQATVASSGVMSDDDPESPSALFGDAAPNDAAAAPDLLQEESAFGQDSWNGGEQTFSEDAKSDDDGFGEESFSTEDAFQDGDGGFQEDTSFSTFEESASGVAGDAAEGGGSSIFSTLWDFFTGGDD